MQNCMMTIDWNLTRAFVATADAGSLSAAARTLGLAQPTLSRQVAALETQLGVALFERVGRKLVLTPTGLGLLDHARTMATAADALALAAAGQSQCVSGRVTLSATDAFSAFVLPGIVERIRAEAPEITISILATDSISDLRRREADIALRHVRPTEPELIGKHIGEMTAHFYASERFIAQHGQPRTSADLAQVPLIAFEPVDAFVAHLASAGVPVSPEQCRITSANAVVLWHMLRQGLGVGVVLDAAAQQLPGLVRIFPDLPSIPVPLWIVTHRELHTSKRVRLVFDILVDALAAKPKAAPRAKRTRPA
jgi:DNA-binding transcriptional LysR family regulator